MNDLDHLLAGLDAHQTWRVVLLFPNSKLPAASKGDSWSVTGDRDRIVSHLRLRMDVKPTPQARTLPRLEPIR